MNILHLAALAVTVTVSASLLADEPKLQGIPLKDIDGKDTSLKAFAGKVVLAVNVASQCGNTPQYAGLQSLYEKFKDKGLVIVGFPCNDFGAQEPGTNAEIKSFCTLKFKTTFPLFAKMSVKGNDASPLYKYLTTLPENGGDVAWNFNKFLVDPDGKVVAHLSSKVEPMSDEMKKKIDAVLPKK